MPTMEELGKLATLLYKESPTVGAKQNINSGLTLDTSVSKAMGFGSQNYFYVWSGEEYTSLSAYFRHFGSSYTYWYDYYRNSSGNQAVCLGD